MVRAVGDGCAATRKRCTILLREKKMIRFTFGVCISLLWLALPPVPVNAQPVATPRSETPADYPRRSCSPVPFARVGTASHHRAPDGSESSEAWVSPSSSTTAPAAAARLRRTRGEVRTDGYTLLFPSISVALAPVLYRKLPYDTEKDPPGHSGRHAAESSGGAPVDARQVRHELIALAKSKPARFVSPRAAPALPIILRWSCSAPPPASTRERHTRADS